MGQSDYVYIRVTQDKYELPLCVRDSIKELAEACGTTKNNIESCISHAKKRKRGRSMYYKVYIGDDDGSERKDS